MKFIFNIYYRRETLKTDWVYIYYEFYQINYCYVNLKFTAFRPKISAQNIIIVGEHIVWLSQ